MQHLVFQAERKYNYQPKQNIKTKNQKVLQKHYKKVEAQQIQWLFKGGRSRHQLIWALHDCKTKLLTNCEKKNYL